MWCANGGLHSRLDWVERVVQRARVENCAYCKGLQHLEIISINFYGLWSIGGGLKEGFPARPANGSDLSIDIVLDEHPHAQDGLYLVGVACITQELDNSLPQGGNL